MGKRGPKPRGEYSGKTAVVSVRLQPDTRRALVAAKKASGRSFTQELEKRLRWSFTDDRRLIDHFGSRQNAAVLKLIGAMIQTVTQSMGTSKRVVQTEAQSGGPLRRAQQDWIQPDPAEWLRDPKMFDAVCAAILHALAWFRPGGADLGLNYDSDVEHLLEEIRAADPASPLGLRSNREHALATLKDDLGELARGRHPGDHVFQSEPGKEARELVERDKMLRKRKREKSGKGKAA